MISPKKVAMMRHRFLLRWQDANGNLHTISAWARVREAKKDVILTVTAEHVRKSISLRGVGDTANCAMAVCATNNAAAFPHNVEGHIDWTYTRAFVVSKVGKNGLPSECYVYEHRDGVARLNDSLDGQHKLLKKIIDEGPIQIRLMPKRIRSSPGRTPGNRKTGARAPEKRLSGGLLRYATAFLASAQPPSPAAPRLVLHTREITAA